MYEDDKAKFCYVVLKQDIAKDPGFAGQLENNTYFDLQTPYGYGGPLSDAPIPHESNMIMSGVDLTTIGELTGHTDIRTLIKLYSHIINDHKKMAVEKLPY